MVFNKKQQEQIDEGRKNGVTDEQIAVYVDERFHWEQMRKIRLLIQNEPDGDTAKLLVAGFNKEVF